MKKLVERHLGNKEDRSAFYTAVSVLINGLTGIGMVVLGLYNRSTFMVANALYYLILFGTRFHALKQYTVARNLESSTTEKFKVEYRVFHRTGAFIILLGVVYIGLNYWLLSRDTVIKESYYPMLATATIGFVKLGVAIRGMIVNRHFKNPIISTIKRVSLIDGIVSIVVTQKSILSFEKSAQAITSASLFGMAVGVIFIGIGLYMVLKKQEKLSFYPEDMAVNQIVI
jgi:hypothetical protein